MSVQALGEHKQALGRITARALERLGRDVAGACASMMRERAVEGELATVKAALRQLDEALREVSCQQSRKLLESSSESSDEEEEDVEGDADMADAQEEEEEEEEEDEVCHCGDCVLSAWLHQKHTLATLTIQCAVSAGRAWSVLLHGGLCTQRWREA